MIEPHVTKKGTKFLVEIEMLKDMDLVYDRSIIMRSLYEEKFREEGINGEFKINTLHFQGIDGVKEDIRKKLIDGINDILNNIH